MEFQQWLIEELNQRADESYRAFILKLTPGAVNVIGVRMPELRKLAKSLMKSGDADSAMRIKDPVYHEIRLLQALLLGQAKMPIMERLEHSEEFLPRIDNWSVCDTFVSSARWITDHRQEVFERFKRYLFGNEYEVRAFVVMLLYYFLQEDWIDRVLAALSAVDHQGYYAKMAVAWALCEAYIKFPDKTWELLAGQGIADEFIRRKALQKILESYKVTDQKKNEIRKIKQRVCQNGPVSV